MDIKDMGRLGPGAQQQILDALAKDAEKRRKNAARAVAAMITPSESDEQMALFEWAECVTGRWPQLRLMFHIPNGRGRSKGEAGKLKAEGVKAGVPDIFLPCARGGYHGLFVEMKSETGTPSDKQKEWKEALEAEGYLCLVCQGFSEAKRAIENYME